MRESCCSRGRCKQCCVEINQHTLLATSRPMSSSLQLQRTIHKTLSQRLSDRRKSRRCALAQMITGLHLGQHVLLSRIADYIPGRAQLNSKTRRLRRFLDNAAVDPYRYYEPVRHLLVQAATQSNERIRLLLDTLELSGHRQILMAALAYRYLRADERLRGQLEVVREGGDIYPVLMNV